MYYDVCYVCICVCMYIACSCVMYTSIFIGFSTCKSTWAVPIAILCLPLPCYASGPFGIVLIRR